MRTTITVIAAVNFISLDITIIVSLFGFYMVKSSAIMAIVTVITCGILHVVMLTNIIFVSPCFHFLMNLQLDIWVYTMFSEIYKILFATITTVGSYIFRIKFKCFFVLFKYRDKGVVIRSVAAYICMYDKIILNTFYISFWDFTKFETAVFLSFYLA